MKRAGHIWMRFKSDEEGAVLLENIVLAGIMLAAAMAIAMGIGAWTDSIWAALTSGSTEPTISLLPP